MTREEMKARTKAYANRVVKLCAALPNNWIARILGQSGPNCRQILDQSSSSLPPSAASVEPTTTHPITD